MIEYTYARIWGLTEDENGAPDWGYLKVNLPRVERESIAGMLFNEYPVENIEIISKEQFEDEAGGDDDE